MAAVFARIGAHRRAFLGSLTALLGSWILSGVLGQEPVASPPVDKDIPAYPQWTPDAPDRILSTADTETVASKVREAVVRVDFIRDGRISGAHTGFLIETDVAELVSETRVRFVAACLHGFHEAFGSGRTGTVRVMLRDGKTLPAVETWISQADVMVIPVRDENGILPRGIPFRDEAREPLKPGEWLGIFGSTGVPIVHPELQANVRNPARHAQKDRLHYWELVMSTFKPLGKEERVVLEQGMSGSPVVDSKGRAVGIQLSEETLSGLGSAGKIGDVKRILRSQGIYRPLAARK